MKVYLLTIGDELLIGQVIDTNSANMAKMLATVGASVVGKMSVGDDATEMHDALQIATQKADVVLITGGLGPTKDDITKKVLAEFLGVGMAFHEPTYRWVQQLFKRFGRTIPDAVKDQCNLPENATVLHNKMGSAPGMWFEHEGAVIVSMPGVPYEMSYLMEHEVVPRLQAHFPGMPVAHRTLLTVGEGESTIAEKLESFESSLPDNFKLAYLPGISQVRLRLSGSNPDADTLEKTLDEKFAEMQSLLPSTLIVGQGDDTLESALGNLLVEKGLTFGTAESCTGGHVAHRITAISGSSTYYMGSIVAYSYEMKERRLDVNKSTLLEHGAVSEETVREMLTGAFDALGVDVAVSISGIAGPGGGMPNKPVGTIWMACGNKEKNITQKLQLGKDRIRNIQYTTVRALNMVRLFVLENY